MFRLKIALLIGGGVLAFFGVQEFRVSSGTSHEAAEVSLAELEQGGELANNHIKVDDHIALYPFCVYEYEQGKYDSGEPDSSTSVTHAYYPIVSLEHPFIQSIFNQEEGYEFESFKVLVKSKRFDTLGRFLRALSKKTQCKAW